MKRRTFVSSIVAFVCLPFPVLRRKCPYTIEFVNTEHFNRFLDGDEIVGIYNHANRTLITNFYKSISDVEKNLKQIMHGDYRRRCVSCTTSIYDCLSTPMRIKCWAPWGERKPGVIYIKMSQDFTPEQAAWRLYEIRQILDT